MKPHADLTQENILRNCEAISEVTAATTPRPRRRKSKPILRRGETFPERREPVGDYFHLKAVENDTRTRAYCGPTAVAAIVDAPVSVVRDGFRTARHGRNWVDSRAPSIRGTSRWEVESVLAMFGYAGEWHNVHGSPTLASFLESRQGRSRTHPSIIGVTGHWVAVCGWQFCDTATRGQVVDATEAPYRRKRVKRIFVITHRIPPSRPIVRRNGQ